MEGGELKETAECEVEIRVYRAIDYTDHRDYKH